MKILRAFNMIRLVTLLLTLSLSLTACAIGQASGQSSSSNFVPRSTPGGAKNTIDLTTTDFVQHALTVKRGSDVVFVVRLDSGPHILCLGSNGHCDPTVPGPAELRQDGGFSVDAGQTLTLYFGSPGVYPVTCSIYPSMNMTITVT